MATWKGANAGWLGCHTEMADWRLGSWAAARLQEPSCNGMCTAEAACGQHICILLFSGCLELLLSPQLLVLIQMCM